MPRPFCKRNLNYCPPVQKFIPEGQETKDYINLTLDEFEAIRLADYEGLYHEEASQMMNISRPTFTRLIDQARKKIARAIIEGKGIEIKGGPVNYLCKTNTVPPHRFCHRRRYCHFYFDIDNNNQPKNSQEKGGNEL